MPTEGADDLADGEIHFLKGGHRVFGETPDSGIDDASEWSRRASVVRQHINDAMGSKHVAFLLGSGCSSRVVKGQQLGIPTMAPMAKEVLSNLSSLEPETDELEDTVGFDISADEFSSNLERLLEVLFSYRFALCRSTNTAMVDASAAADRLIKKLVSKVVDLCEGGEFNQDGTVLGTYEAFYRKLVYRDRALPRPWVFTTNYDLFSERAMDRQGIPFCNGFSGSVERRFNPALFRYSLAEQIELSSSKWTAVDSFVYLCKLHGSINWSQDGDGLFPIKELQHPCTPADDEVMIFPTPSKQNASFGAPYSDLFREFQSRVVQDQSVLFCIGYSFGDEHVNNLIFRALTIPTFRLIAFVPLPAAGIVNQLRELNDPRVWLIGGGSPVGRLAHYFDVFVDDFLPEPPSDDAERAIDNAIRDLIRTSRDTKEIDGS